MPGLQFYVIGSWSEPSLPEGNRYRVRLPHLPRPGVSRTPFVASAAPPPTSSAPRGAGRTVASPSTSCTRSRRATTSPPPHCIPAADHCSRGWSTGKETRRKRQIMCCLWTRSINLLRCQRSTRSRGIVLYPLSPPGRTGSVLCIVCHIVLYL